MIDFSFSDLEKKKSTKRQNKDVCPFDCRMNNKNYYHCLDKCVFFSSGSEKIYNKRL